MSHASKYAANDRHDWRRVPNTERDAIAPGGLEAKWQDHRHGWHVYKNGQLISMGGIRNLDGSYVFSVGFRNGATT